MNNRFRGCVWPLLVLVVGCQTVPPPTSDLSDADLRIEQALAADAETHAPVELQFARDKLERAKASIAAKDFDVAQRLIAESRADADLARVRARAAQLRAEVAKQGKANDALRVELLGRSGQ